MTQLTHIHFCYPKPLHFGFCRFVPTNLLPPDPKMLFSSVSAEQEELVAKMLASGMDEATAYQYLQQMCGNAGKGSKPKTFDPKLSTSPQNAVHTAMSLLTSICPQTHKYLSLYKYLQDFFSLYLCFGFSLSRSPASCSTALYFNAVQPM